MTAFTRALVAEIDLLQFLKITKGAYSVQNTVIDGLSMEDAQLFAYSFVYQPISLFVAELNC